MGKYISKPILIEAISFDELVTIGKELGGNIVSGFPWSFFYNGMSVTHENDECYLITTEFHNTIKFTPSEMLIMDGVLVWTCDKNAFNVVYEPLNFTDKLKRFFDKALKSV